MPKSDSQSPQFVLLASKQDVRVIQFQQALGRRGLPKAKLVSYPEFAKSPERLYEILDNHESILRIDSPGRIMRSYRAILESGIAPLQQKGELFLTPETILKQAQQKGRIISPKQLHAGFQSMMQQVSTQLSDLPKTQVMNHPDDIMLAYDKVTCQKSLQQAGLNIPESLNEIKNYDQLREQMKKHNMPRVFIKLRYGSAASGIIALETNGKHTQITTTVDYEKHQDELVLFNTRKLLRFRKEREIRLLVNALCEMGVQVERWVPKAQMDGLSIDLRVLVINGYVYHRVVRMSETPITNLHLLNLRSHYRLLKYEMQAKHWKNLMKSCISAADVFNQSFYMTFDIAILPNYKSHRILEANAFGDLLKDCYYERMLPYDAEISAWQYRQSMISQYGDSYANH